MKAIREKKTLSEMAYDELQKAIIEGELSQGDPLVEDRLAEKLNVSRTVIRRALLKLQENNLAVKNPQNNRMFVKKINKKEILDSWEVRKALEVLAVKKIIQYIEKSEIKKLHSYFRKYENRDLQEYEFTEEELNDYANQDRKFHKYIAKLSNNDVLVDIIENFQIQAKTFNIGIIRYPHETLEEHFNIIKAIKDKDTNTAEELMEEHLRKSMKKIETIEFSN